MILSVHIPKTAGRSFQVYLQDVFGPRLMNDYGDWVEIKTKEGVDHDERRRLDMLSRIVRIRTDFDAIHGHYLPSKYANDVADPRILAFVRDPYQHAISSYHHAVRHEAGTHAAQHLFNDKRMTLVDLIEAFPNHQASYLSGLAVEDLAMVGITEAYERSVALFQVVFGIETRPGVEWQNVNPMQRGKAYKVTDDVRRAVDRYRAEDVALYNRARERFETLARRHDL